MDSNKKAVIEALEQSLGVVTTACKSIDLARSTFYSWYNSDEEFKAAVDDIQEIAVDVAESELHKLIKNGETTAIIFFLKTKGKKRGYVERTEMEHQGAVPVTLNETRNYHRPNETTYQTK
jgi:hypothetical protein